MSWFRKIVWIVRLILKKIKIVEEIINLTQDIKDSVEKVFYKFSTDPDVKELKEKVVELWTKINELRDP